MAVNIGDFIQAGVSGVPLLFVVMVVVELLKDAGLSNPYIMRLAAWGSGILLGALYQVAVVGVPANLLGWLTVAVYGLLLGVAAGKLYDLSGKIIKKAIAGILVALGIEQPE